MLPFTGQLSCTSRSCPRILSLRTLDWYVYFIDCRIDVEIVSNVVIDVHHFVVQMQSLAVDVSLAGLLGDSVYNFGELLLHPIVRLFILMNNAQHHQKES